MTSRPARSARSTRSTYLALPLAILLLSPLAGEGAAAHAQLAVDQMELVLAPARRPPGIPVAKDSTPPGPGAVGVFTVTNDGDAPVQATITLEDWDRTESGENRFYPLGTHAGSCRDRLQVFPRTVRLDPRASQSVRVTVVGADSLAGPGAGACWSVAFVTTTAPGIASGRQITYVLRTGVKIYVEPPGLPRDAVVDAMQVRPAAAPAAAAPAGRELAATFRNTGGVHLLARGTVEIRRPDNSVAATIPVAEFPMLPGARRVVALPLPALAPGQYVALALLDFGGPELVAGQIQFEVR